MARSIRRKTAFAFKEATPRSFIAFLNMVKDTSHLHCFLEYGQGQKLNRLCFLMLFREYFLFKKKNILM
jgi:hypothetical protein